MTSRFDRWAGHLFPFMCNEPVVEEPKSNWRCAHEWSRWRDVARGTVTYFGGLGGHPVLIQERECRKCGLKTQHQVSPQE